jgi:hypothetical protein
MMDWPLVEAFKWGMLQTMADQRGGGVRLDEPPRRDEWYRAMAELIAKGLACDQSDPTGIALFHVTPRGLEIAARSGRRAV